MRRIDALGIGLVVFVAGGLIYVLLQVVGLDHQKAGIWSQVVVVGGLVGWLLTYLLRVVTQRMTYNRQLADYQAAVLQKRLEELSPEEVAKIQSEIELENHSAPENLSANNND
jgi:hypothetical protein